MKRTVAKTSVRSSEMALGLGGGEFWRILCASLRTEPLLVILSENKKIFFFSFLKNRMKVKLFNSHK